MGNYKEQGNPTAKSITYQGCATTPGFAGKWCYVNGHQNCKVAKPSLDKAEPKFWRKCFQCSCMDSWNYKGTQYKGWTANRAHARKTGNTKAKAIKHARRPRTLIIT